MRIYVTGAAGFIGSVVCRRLRSQGVDVVAVVRDPERAGPLREIGCEVRFGDLTSPEALTGGMRGCDGVIHLAGMYRVGIAKSERSAMYDANVGATHRVLQAAIVAGVPRIVHVSSAIVLGDTQGRIVDENHRRDVNRGFFSYYDETKYLAHGTARELIASGAPILIAMPGNVYGPGDNSGVGRQLKLAFEGRARYVALGDMGISLAHVEDVAAGILATLEQGRLGESYLLAGPNLRMRELMETAARVGGHRLTRLTIPTGLIRFVARLGHPVARALRQPPDLGEIVASGDGRTYWVSSAKASLKLGYSPRELEAGLRDAFGRRPG